MKEINKYFIHDWDDPDLVKVSHHLLMNDFLPEGYTFDPFLVCAHGYWYIRVYTPNSHVTCADEKIVKLVGKAIGNAWEKFQHG